MLIHRKLNTYAEVIEKVTPTHVHREKMCTILDVELFK